MYIALVPLGDLVHIRSGLSELLLLEDGFASAARGRGIDHFGGALEGQGILTHGRQLESEVDRFIVAVLQAAVICLAVQLLVGLGLGLDAVVGVDDAAGLRGNLGLLRHGCSGAVLHRLHIQGIGVTSAAHIDDHRQFDRRLAVGDAGNAILLFRHLLGDGEVVFMRIELILPHIFEGDSRERLDLVRSRGRDCLFRGQGHARARRLVRRSQGKGEAHRMRLHRPLSCSKHSAALVLDNLPHLGRILAALGVLIGVFNRRGDRPVLLDGSGAVGDFHLTIVGGLRRLHLSDFILVARGDAGDRHLVVGAHLHPGHAVHKANLCAGFQA